MHFKHAKKITQPQSFSMIIHQNFVWLLGHLDHTDHPPVSLKPAKSDTMVCRTLSTALL